MDPAESSNQAETPSTGGKSKTQNGPETAESTAVAAVAEGSDDTSNMSASTTAVVSVVKLPHPKPALTIQVPGSSSQAKPQKLKKLQKLPKTPTLRLIPPLRPGTSTSSLRSAGGTTAIELRSMPTSRTNINSSTPRRTSQATVRTIQRRPIKYGHGRYAGVELVPQPSNDHEDPLNWPSWKKELNYAALLVATAVACASKTVLVPVNSQVATDLRSSYTAVTALTGVPLVLSASTGLAALAASRVWGRRPAYLVAIVLQLGGLAWAAAIGEKSFGQLMAARILQGLSWGVFDTLVLGSIQDTFFEHEMPLRLTVYDFLVLAATWGGPLIGGVVSDHDHGLVRQLGILSGLATVSALLVAVGAPETVFDRSFYRINTPVSATSPVWSDKRLSMPQQTRTSTTRPSHETGAHEWLRAMRPCSYRANASGSMRSLSSLLLQPARALLAPSTLLLAVVSLLPFGTLWSLASSLSLLFVPLPFRFAPSTLSALLLAPWLLSTLVVVAAGVLSSWMPAKQCWQRWHRRVLSRTTPMLGPPGTTTTSTAAIAVPMGLVATGSLLFFMGLLSFGFYVASQMGERTASSQSDLATDSGTSLLSLPATSLALGLLAAGAHILDSAVQPVVRSSTQFTSTNLAVARRSTADMCAGVGLWRTLAAGVFVIALPSGIWAWRVLRSTAIGLVVAQAVVAVAVVAAWWWRDEMMRRMDGRVMNCTEQQATRFYDSD